MLVALIIDGSGDCGKEREMREKHIYIWQML